MISIMIIIQRIIITFLAIDSIQESSFSRNFSTIDDGSELDNDTNISFETWTYFTNNNSINGNSNNRSNDSSDNNNNLLGWTVFVF